MGIKRKTIFKILILFLVSMMTGSCTSNKVQQLAKENSELRAKNEVLEKEITELRAQNEELKGKLSKFESKEMELGKTREAIKALQRLDARFSAGIGPRDLAPALGETIFQVNLFLESPEASKNPQLTESIQKVLLHYKIIGELMDSYVLGIVKGPLEERVKSLYPEVSKIYDHGQLKNIALRVVLPKASKELEKAKSLLPQ